MDLMIVCFYKKIEILLNYMSLVHKIITQMSIELSNDFSSIDCKNKGDCNRSDCKYKHPDGHVPKKTDCRVGVKCPHRKCVFTHPASWNWQSNIECRLNLECPNISCSYKHDDGWNPRLNIDCRLGKECKVADCKFRHSEVKSVPKIVSVIRKCRDGDSCSNPICKFKHSDTWDHHKNISCKFGPTCKNKSTTCKFKH